jgi:hypothetical protein
MSTQPVPGYTGQSEKKIQQVSWHKLVEERLLRDMEKLASGGCDGPVDQRWIAIAKTHIEQGFMALNRSVFQPQRLDDDTMRKLLKDQPV